MNKANLQKLFVHFGIVAVCFVIALFAYSCKKDAKSNTNTPAALTPAVVQAKSWYDKLYQKKKTDNLAVSDVGSSTLDLTNWIKPDWQHASSYLSKNKNVIEIPIDPTVKFISTIKYGNYAFNKNYSRSSYLLINDGKSYQAYILTILADSAYVNNDLNKLSHNTYRKQDADFGGLGV